MFQNWEHSKKNVRGCPVSLPAAFIFCALTGVGQIQVCSAGGQHPGVDAGHNVGLIHDEVHDIVICGQLALQATPAQRESEQ